MDIVKIKKQPSEIFKDLDIDIENSKLEWFEITKNVVDTSIKRIKEWDLPVKISLEFQENHPKSEEYREFFSKVLCSEI